MKNYQEITCPHCGGDEIIKSGRNSLDVQRYRCQNVVCKTKTFMLKYRYRAYYLGIKKQIIDMVISGGGIRDTAKMLKMNYPAPRGGVSKLK